MRLTGLDLARFLALIGMVIVNFDVVVAMPAAGSQLAAALQGRAAATFLVLAGIGLGLGARYATGHNTRRVIQRAGILLAIGLLNALVFPPDIIHYYGVYFLLATPFLRGPGWVLWLAMAVLISGFILLALTLNYDAGWNWPTYEYLDFWTPEGFFRNLWFNGWHPVLPWFAFVLFGLWLSRRTLSSRKVQLALILAGALILSLSTAISIWLQALTATTDADLATLFGTAPIPPGPLFVVAGCAASCLVIGSCLRIASALPNLALIHAAALIGRQTLTLYIAHILLGMGTLEALGMIATQSGHTALLCSAIFCLLASAFALTWSRYFNHGPLESLMRRWTR